MMDLIYPKGITKNVVTLISNPITEMVCAFIIDMSRNYILGVIHPFLETDLNYLFLVSILLLFPWIMLGHGAIRYIQNKKNEFVKLSNNNPSHPQIQKKNLNLFIFLLTTYIIIRLITF